MTIASSASDEPEIGELFVYGTLAPSSDREAAEGGFVADQVRGRLYDLGPHPALVDLDDPRAGLVEGFRRAVTETELVEKLDPYEDVESGTFRREATRTAQGVRVWIYVYGRAVPEEALRRGPLVRWRPSTTSERPPI